MEKIDFEIIKQGVKPTPINIFLSGNNGKSVIQEDGYEQIRARRDNMSNVGNLDYEI